jgi:hypothetical protein
LTPSLLTTGVANKNFEGPLDTFLKQVQSTSYLPQKTPVAPLSAVQDQQPEQSQAMPSDYFNYGQQSDISKILFGDSSGNPIVGYKAGGMATPLMATGGMSTPLMAAGGTRHGKNAGRPMNVVHHEGKMRVDFRTGDAVTGAGDGQSDDIPAMLADGEFVFPADVVSALGNGSTKAGSDKLYEMMHSIRARARSNKPKDLPPPAKSPLDYLKGSKKGRR